MQNLIMHSHVYTISLIGACLGSCFRTANLCAAVMVMMIQHWPGLATDCATHSDDRCHIILFIVDVPRGKVLCSTWTRGGGNCYSRSTLGSFAIII